MIESLEKRALMAVTANVTHRGTLVVHGTEETDVITVAHRVASVVVSVAGSETFRFPAADVKRLLVESHGGDDVVNSEQFDRIATLAGGGGRDDLRAGRAATLIGGGGNDFLRATGRQTFRLEDGIVVETDARPCLLSGGLGNDVLQAAGPATLVGGGGVDEVIVTRKPADDDDETPTVGTYNSIGEAFLDEYNLVVSGVERYTIQPAPVGPFSARYDVRALAPA